SGTASQYVVSLVFNSDGATKFAKATQDNIGKYIYIYLDDQQVSAATVNTAITDGKAIIEGNFTLQQVKDLATTISEGSLPFNLTTISVQNIGATLGATALSTTVLAGLIGTILVLLFMALFYRTLGGAADLALLIYIGLNLVIISMLRITLTLPGMAGIILSIGMAVDANVVIFERTREEIASGKSLKASIDLGFKRAFNAIIDSHVTTFIAALVLFFLGTGTIKGFAETLMIGIVVSLFTAFLLTRTFVKALIDVGITRHGAYIGVKREKTKDIGITKEEVQA
ncbi:MAG: protein translocase subunit SecD, partial [Defluviitaleaceae bacterium]|nr:protein translocase subunit SecD [Defluviitaleaceae bacterium]